MGLNHYNKAVGYVLVWYGYSNKEPRSMGNHWCYYIGFIVLALNPGILKTQTPENQNFGYISP